LLERPLLHGIFDAGFCIEIGGMIVRVRGRVVADALVEVLAAVKRAR
jgi:hypothetical protein